VIFNVTFNIIYLDNVICDVTFAFEK